MALDGRIAIVTGASQGIGFAVARALAARGVQVAGLARDEARLREAARSVGPAFRPHACDVGDAAATKRAVAAVRERSGGIDILVNSAGIGRFGAVEAFADADWNALLATNLSGVFHCIREVVPAMKARGGGHIVNIASLAALAGYPGASGYNATKFAVRGLSESLAKELGPAGIKVSVLYPGSTDTAFGSGPAKPALQPAEVAQAVLHILEAPGGALVSEMVLRPFP